MQDLQQANIAFKSRFFSLEMKLAGVLPDLLRLEELNSTDGKMRLGT
jgi:hypothetical protein